MRKDLFVQVERATGGRVRGQPKGQTPPPVAPLDCRSGTLSSVQTWQFLEELRRMAAESVR